MAERGSETEDMAHLGNDIKGLAMCRLFFKCQMLIASLRDELTEKGAKTVDTTQAFPQC